VAKTCIVIADDHALCRSGLRKLLESKAHLSVVVETASGDEVATLVKSLKPDILLLDVCLPRLSGLGVLQQLGSSSTRVILLTANIENSDAVQALQWGIHGIVLKNATTESVFRSIDAVMDGQYWIFSRGVEGLDNAMPSVDCPHLNRQARLNPAGFA